MIPASVGKTVLRRRRRGYKHNFKDTKSGAGEQFLLQDRMPKACLKGIVFFTDSGIGACHVMPCHSEGGMIRLEALIELKFHNSSFSSSSFSTRASRAHPLIETRRTVPCRAIRGNSISVNGILPPS